MEMASETVNRVDSVDDIEFMEDEEEARVEPKPNAKENRSDNDEKESKKVKVCTSIAWKYFTKIGVVDGKEKAECNACGQQYVIGGSKVGTSHLLRHVKLLCKKKAKFHDVGGMIIDHAGKLRSREVDQKRVLELLTMCIVRHGLPFNFVEYKWVRELLSYINSDVKHVSRNTLVSSLLKLHGEMKEKLKYAIHKCHNRICLTSDCWTACTQEGYICLTTHFVDNNWKLNSKILAFCKLEPPHTGEDLANKVFEVLTEWEIDRKIFSITLDNASANDRMQELLGEQLRLQNSLLCDGEFLHVRCCAHVLNLIVQDGLKVAEVALQKIRDNIKYVRASESRKIVFTECIAQVRGIDTKVGLRLDVPTRWNSTYIMLESALRYRRAFASFTIRDRKYKCCPSNEEWKRAEKLCEFLKPFYKMTNLISGIFFQTS